LICKHRYMLLAESESVDIFFVNYTIMLATICFVVLWLF